MGDERLQGGLADHLGDAVYVVDTDRRITYWNGAAERLTGYLSCDVVGRRCGATLLAHVAEDGTSLCGPRCPLDATIRDGQEREVNASLRSRTGGSVPVHIRASALRTDGVITGAVEVFRDDTAGREARRTIAQLQALVLEDPLTGVGNRRALDRAYEQQLDACAVSAETFAVVVLDLDHFKDVNDRYGHGTGDVVLCHVAQSLRQAVRPHDHVARLGGDEFAVVTGPITQVHLDRLVARLVSFISGVPTGSRPHAIDVGVSVGVALVGAGEPAQSALARADADLYAHTARRAPVAGALVVAAVSPRRGP